ncbi:undecaprenyl-diphosphatase UppP [soil metagenome]
MWMLYVWMAMQIIVEVLPISSSSHLRLLEAWFKRTFSWDVAEYFSKKNIALADVYYLLHLPTLGIVVFFFIPYLHMWFLQPGLLPRILIWVIVADVITACFYYLFKKYSIAWPMLFGLCITALALLYTGACDPTRGITDWSYTTAIWLGIAQGIAIMPGISRLAFTTAAGCCLGFSLLHAFIISWLIYVPLMAAAIAKSGINLYQKGTLSQLLNIKTCLVMLVSGALSWYLFIRLLLPLIFLNKWWLLGWYMALPIGLWILLAKKD